MITENMILAAVAMLNLTSTITNIIYIALSKRLQINKDLLSNMTEQSKADDVLMKKLKQQKRELNAQYEEILLKYKKLEGRYNELTGVEHRTINQSLVEVPNVIN